MNTRTFEFRTLLADSLAVVEVSCEIDEDGDCVEFNHIKFNDFDIFEVISQNQWDDLEHDAKTAYKCEQEEQSTIDYDNNSPLKAVYGLSKPSFHIR